MERRPLPPTSKPTPWLLFAGVVSIMVVLVYWRAHDKPHKPAGNTHTIDALAAPPAP